jgi:hypothetical protein
VRLTPADLDSQFDDIQTLVHSHLVREGEANAYGGLLCQLKDDVTLEDSTLLLGLRRAPAAQGNHHAMEGGLLFHYLEMWDIWLGLSSTMDLDREQLTHGTILKGIINHDLHKAWRTYRLESEEPWQTQYADDETDKLLDPYSKRPQGHFKSLFILQQHGIRLDLVDYNVILNAEGGWSKSQTYWCSVAAKVCYLLDELSGNVKGRQATGRWLGHNQEVVEETEPEPALAGEAAVSETAD